MKRTRFLISSMLAAGFGAQDAANAAFISATTTRVDDPDKGTLFRVFSQDHLMILAQHRSHSSHSSHRSGYGGGHYSHTSHRSSTGGGYGDSSYTAPAYTRSAPRPTPTPTPAPDRASQPLVSLSDRATAPAEPATSTLSGRTKRFAAIVRRVQIALLAQGFYNGRIDGIVGPALRSALRRFQGSRSLAVTGTITPESLDALMVSSN